MDEIAIITEKHDGILQGVDRFVFSIFRHFTTVNVLIPENRVKEYNKYMLDY